MIDNASILLVLKCLQMSLWLFTEHCVDCKNNNTITEKMFNYKMTALTSSVHMRISLLNCVFAGLSSVGGASYFLLTDTSTIPQGEIHQADFSLSSSKK